ncbi:Atxe2 family lasso peptide isopeptidase [Oleiagrimonas sp. C23AA]|uniref:Atxe2 family lasso peptide isopeptidase n=1 Tax=Oleiagrimonas sp. C23AA TaxID=2719047 RepID=UPI00141ED920|nr:Atxe2 family lasso peptide isopeptidase [Oleiagrimonas sp. C23AA]NII09471.1 Atxe2 family lasso peptide isopeptidase [Oleiagrimonas sp. C23AA]
MFKLKCAMWRSLMVGAFLAMGASVAHATMVSPRRLLEVADIAGPVISPDGGRVAFRVERASVARDTYSSVWYVQGLDDPLPQRVGDGGVPLRDSAGEALSPKVVWSPDGRWIYFRALINGNVQVWRAAANGSGAAPVTHDAGNVRHFRLASDGRVLEYSVGATRAAVRAAERAEYDHGIHIDASVPIGQGLFRSAYVDGRLATQRFGKVWFNRVPLLADAPIRWRAVELATGKTHAVAKPNTPRRPSLDPGTAGVPGDPWKSARDAGSGKVAWLTRVGKRNGQEYRPRVLLSALPNAQATQAVVCKAAMCVGKSISAIQWRPGHDEVLFTVTDPRRGLAQSIYRWKLATGQVQRVVKASGLVNGGRRTTWQCGASAKALACVTASAGQPPRLERIDLPGGQRHVLFDPNAVLAQDMAKIPVHLLQWKDAQGRWFTGKFYAARRDGDGAPPLFITYYSCPGFVRGGVGDEWPLATLAQDGIAALCINRRPDYTMDAVARYGEGLSAVRSVVKRLASKGRIDRTRVGMGGLSFGGEVTMWTVMKSHLLAAASVANPVVSPLYRLIGSMKGKAFGEGLREHWGVGSPSQTPARWKVLSPAANLHAIRAPILFQHSEQEYMYALDYEIPLIREHRADLYVFPNEPHQKFRPRHKLAVYERNLDWFRFWLQGYEDPVPSKKAQYARWRVMRQHVKKAGVGAAP